MLFGILTIISGIIELGTMGAGELSTLQALMEPEVPEYTNPIGATAAYMTVAWDYMQNLWDILWFNYAFFEGEWLLIKYIVFWPVSIGIIMTFIFVMRGVGSD